MNNILRKISSGFSLIELLIAISIFALATSAIINLVVSSYYNNLRSQYETQAQKIAQEGLEAARSIRDRNFILIKNGQYGLDNSSDQWEFSGSGLLVDNYYYSYLTIEDMYRDMDGDIVSSGGNSDIDSKKVSSTVEWTDQNNISHSISLFEYLTNFRGKDKIDTLTSEFALGTFINTAVHVDPPPPEGNGSVQLQETTITSNLAADIELGGPARGMQVLDDYLYAVTEEKDGGFTIINLTDPLNPQFVTTLKIDGRGNNVSVNGTYAYLVTQSPAQAFVVVNIMTLSSPTLLSQIALTAGGRDIVADGDYAYITTLDSDKSWYVIDISNPAQPQPVVEKNLWGAGAAIYKLGDILYVTTSAKLLYVYDISDPLDPDLLSWLSLKGEATDIDVDFNYLYIVTSSSNYLTVFDISDPSYPIHLEDIALPNAPRGISVQDNYAYVAMNNASAGLGIVNVAYPPTAYYVTSMDVGEKGLAVESTADYVYLALDDGDGGVMAVTGTASTGFQPEGQYESPIYSSGSGQALFNYLDWTEEESPAGNVRFQIRTATSSGNILSESWVGPDGTSGTYYEDARTSIIPSPTTSGTNFFQYKAYFTCDGLSTPFVQDVTINYTP